MLVLLRLEIILRKSFRCIELKEIGVPHIIAKAKNKQFKVVLEKIGADRVVRPEKEMGERVARSMLRKNITDLVEIDESYSIVEMKVPLAWVGHSLNGLDLRKITVLIF